MLPSQPALEVVPLAPEDPFPAAFVGNHATGAMWLQHLERLACVHVLIYVCHAEASLAGVTKTLWAALHVLREHVIRVYARLEPIKRFWGNTPTS